MPNLTELIAQRDALEQKITALRSEQRESALADIRQLMGEHGLSLADLSDKSPAPRSGGRSSVAPKYRNPATGETWSGRGRQPRWLAAAIASGRTADDFRI